MATAFGFYNNSATSTIDGGATVDAGGKLSVTSEALNDFQFSFGVNLYAAAAQKYQTTDEPGANNVTINNGDIVEVESNHSGGGTIGHIYQAVGGTRTVDLTDEDFSNTQNWADLGTPGKYQLKNVVANLSTYLDSNYGLDNNLADTWSQANATNGVGQIAAAIPLTYDALNYTSNASIGQALRSTRTPTRPTAPARRASSCWPPTRTRR